MAAPHLTSRGDPHARSLEMFARSRAANVPALIGPAPRMPTPPAVTRLPPAPASRACQHPHAVVTHRSPRCACGLAIGSYRDQSLHLFASPQFSRSTPHSDIGRGLGSSTSAFNLYLQPCNRSALSVVSGFSINFFSSISYCLNNRLLQTSASVALGRVSFFTTLHGKIS